MKCDGSAKMFICCILIQVNEHVTYALVVLCAEIN